MYRNRIDFQGKFPPSYRTEIINTKNLYMMSTQKKGSERGRFGERKRQVAVTQNRLSLEYLRPGFVPYVKSRSRVPRIRDWLRGCQKGGRRFDFFLPVHVV